MSMQETHYTTGVDYTKGSPHLSHPALRSALAGQVLDALLALRKRGLPMRVLEVGAGHGGYTEPALAAGAEVTAVDMSRASLEHLTGRYGGNPNLTTVFSEDGSLSGAGDGYTLLLGVSVLHHIPDYVGFLRDALPHLSPGASVLTLQDPLWYPRLPRGVRQADRVGYALWRIGQGDLRRAAATAVRRLRRELREDMSGDMVEYHVVRQGVDEQAILDLLRPSFERVELLSYWSNQLRSAHIAGRGLGIANTFGVLAEGYQPATPEQ